MKLFWVTTEDHTEDWFVFAETKEEAEEMHEDFEGIDEGDARAVEVMDVPVNIAVEKGWPYNDQLIKMGGIFIQLEPMRIVKINGVIYVEGDLESSLNPEKH